MIKIWNIILLIILLVIAFFLALKLLRSVVRAIFTTISLVILGAIIFGLILYSDFSDLQEVLVDDTTFVLEHDGNYLASARPVGDEIQYYTVAELNEYINESDDELFIVLQRDFIITEDTEVTLPVQNITLSEELPTIFEAESIEEIINIIVTEQELSGEEALFFEMAIEDQYDETEQLKAELLASILAQDENLINTVIAGAGKGEVKFKPSFLSLRFITNYPGLFFNGEVVEE